MRRSLLSALAAFSVLATLAQKWSLRRAEGHPVAMQPLITLRPKHGMPMTLAIRQTPLDANSRRR